jgi:hypothetical protein
MKIRLIFALAFLLVNQWLLAQTHTFKVLVSKGKTEIKNENNWQLIKVGASLKSTDEVKIGENAYLGLIHISGKPLEVREARTYKVSELISKVTPGTSVINKYTDFILSSEQQKKNRLSATGAVHRGPLVPKDVILAFLPESDLSKVYGDQVTIAWSTENVKGPYQVIFSNLMEEDVARVDVTESFVTISLNDDKFKREPQVMVRITAKDKPGSGSKNYIIKRLPKDDRAKIDSLMSQLDPSMDRSLAVTQYVLAGFYEENLLLVDALTAYREAYMKAPDVELYKVAYDEFLKRMEFK